MTKFLGWLFCSILLVSTSFNGHAQRGFELGGWVGPAVYFGDLNTNYDITKPGAGGGALMRYNFNERVSWQFSLNYAYIHANDNKVSNAFQQSRDLNFFSHIGDFTTSVEFNFLPYFHGHKDYFWTPFIGIGGSAYYFNPMSKYDGVTYKLRHLGTEGQELGNEYYPYQLGICLTGGVKYDITGDWSVNVFINFRRLFNDYLDDVSKTYPDFQILEDIRGEEAVIASDPTVLKMDDNRFGMLGRQRGNSKNNDSYNFFGIGLVYYFGTVQCPDFND